MHHLMSYSNDSPVWQLKKKSIKVVSVYLIGPACLIDDLCQLLQEILQNCLDMHVQLLSFQPKAETHFQFRQFIPDLQSFRVAGRPDALHKFFEVEWAKVPINCVELMFQAHWSSIRPPLHALIQFGHLIAVVSSLSLKHAHLLLDKPLSNSSLMKLVLIDKDLVGVVIGVIAGHLEALTFCCGATLDLGDQLTYVLFHLNSQEELIDYMGQKKQKGTYIAGEREVGMGLINSEEVFFRRKEMEEEDKRVFGMVSLNKERNRGFKWLYLIEVSERLLMCLELSNVILLTVIRHNLAATNSDTRLPLILFLYFLSLSRSSRPPILIKFITS